LNYDTLLPNPFYRQTNGTLSKIINTIIIFMLIYVYLFIYCCCCRRRRRRRRHFYYYCVLPYGVKYVPRVKNKEMKKAKVGVVRGTFLHRHQRNFYEPKHN